MEHQEYIQCPECEWKEPLDDLDLICRCHKDESYAYPETDWWYCRNCGKKWGHE